MRTFETILVGFDGSDTGHDGLLLATGLAKASGARVVVAFVYDAALTASSMAAAAELLEHADTTLASARRSLSQGLDASFEAIAAHSPADGIQKLASTHHADLIVLGSRGLGPATRIALGSVSHQVVAAARCPVAIAPGGYRDHGGYVPQAIGLSTSPFGEAPQAAALAHALAAATGGTVHVVASVAAGASGEARHQAATELEVAAVVEDLTDELVHRSSTFDVIVVQSDSAATGAPDLGPPALEIIERARCPVLIVPSVRAAP